jgi:ADP-ribosylglycohydrolase
MSVSSADAGDRTQQRARAALRSLFVGDALSMPVHWFYNPMDIQRAFPGGIRQMEPAPAFHPSSIMSLHSTSDGGRGTQRSTSAREIVGEVILRGKRQYWGISNQHYHQGMPAGENTLNAWWARTLMKTLINADSHYDQQQYLHDYIDFMTADPPRHPDTYAESCHRGFFANLERGLDPAQCAAVTHDTPSVGGLVTILPLAISQLLRGTPVAEVCQLCRTHLFLTHPDELLGNVCDALVELIATLLHRENDDALDALATAAKAIPGTNLHQLIKKAPSDLYVIGRTYSSACYITDSWPGLLYLAGKYRDDARAAMLANTNVGGENAHRGSVLGCIVSLITADTADDLFDQLRHREAIADGIEKLLQCSETV